MWERKRGKKSRRGKYNRPDWSQAITETAERMKHSDFFAHLATQVEKSIKVAQGQETDSIALGDQFGLVCLGLGSISNSRSSRHQLALLDCLVAHFANVELVAIYDPAFTEEDLAILRARYPSCALTPFEQPRPKLLLYLPHVPVWLLDQTLRIQQALLQQTVTISNNMNTLWEVVHDKHRKGDFKFKICL